MRTYGNYFTIKALAIDEDEVIKEVRILPESVVVAPWFYDIEGPESGVFYSHNSALNVLLSRLNLLLDEHYIAQNIE